MGTGMGMRGKVREMRSKHWLGSLFDGKKERDGEKKERKIGRKAKQKNEIRKTIDVSEETSNCSSPEVKGRDELEEAGGGGRRARERAVEHCRLAPREGVGEPRVSQQGACH